MAILNDQTLSLLLAVCTFLFAFLLNDDVNVINGSPYRTWKELRTKFAATSLLFINVNINVCERFRCEKMTKYLTPGELDELVGYSVESEANYLIKKYLVGNPAVKSVKNTQC